MNLSYGLAKTGVSTITNASVQFTEDTDLGIQTDFQADTSKSPSKGMIKTTETSDGSDNQRGSGYTLGTRRMTSNVDNVLGVIGEATCSATGGTGAGAIFQVRTIYSRGVLVINNLLLLKPDLHNVSTTAKSAAGDPLTESTTPITGSQAGGNGANATYQVNFVRGNVTSVIVIAGGTGYITGPTGGGVITLAKADIEAGLGAGKVVSNDLIVIPQQGDVSGGIGSVINITNGGSGYTAADELTLQEIGSSDIGDGKVVVATLDTGFTVNTKPNNRYPRAIMISTVGADADAPAAVTVKDLEGNFVTMAGMLTGVIRPFRFTQVALATGETPTIGEVTIYY
jgi:hypothetical protein